MGFAVPIICINDSLRQPIVQIAKKNNWSLIVIDGNLLKKVK